jgi:flagellin-like protein
VAGCEVNIMRFMKDEEAVSPVIGVILMVAITVILAAVIAVFVFGLAGDLESGAQKDVQLTAGTANDGSVYFTVFSGSDIDKLTQINITNGTGVYLFNGTDLQTGRKLDTIYPKSGESVIATGYFNDDTSQVLGKSSN